MGGMSASNAYRIWPGLPAPDEARVAQLSPDAVSDAFGEDRRKALAALADRVRAEMRSGELTEALAVIHHLRAGLVSLNPGDLNTRRGIGGLFDSRKRRLKAFRARFGEVTRTLAESLDDLQVRVGAVNRRSGTLEQLWTDIRHGVLEMDDFVAACLRKIAPAPDPASGNTLHPVHQRGHRLADARDAALRLLPQVRVGQNADGQAARRLKMACDAMIEWHHEWADNLGVRALGVKGSRKPKKVAPDHDRLSTSRDTVLAMLDAAAREVEIARQRRVEADGRIEAARRAI
jgi:hypothetical protein